MYTHCISIMVNSNIIHYSIWWKLQKEHSEELDAEKDVSIAKANV